MEQRRKQVEKLEERNAANNAKRAEEQGNVDDTQQETSTTEPTESSLSYHIEKFSNRIHPHQSHSNNYKAVDNAPKPVPEFSTIQIKRASSLIASKGEMGTHDQDTNTSTDSIIINCNSHGGKTPRDQPFQTPRRQNTSSGNIKGDDQPIPSPKHPKESEGTTPQDYAVGCNEFISGNVVDILKKTEDDVEGSQGSQDV